MRERTRGENLSGALEKIGDVVPSAYYDLIARIVPGVAVVATVSYLLRFTPTMGDGERTSVAAHVLPPPRRFHS